MKEIPIKNYIITIIISLLTIVLVFSLMNKYNTRNNKLLFLSEVKEDNLNEFITEKNDIIIYFSKNKHKELDSELEKYLQNNEVKNNIIYVDLNNVSKHFDDDFSKNYSTTLIDIKDPTLVIIEDKKVTNYLSDMQNINDIKNFIERYSE